MLKAKLRSVLRRGYDIARLAGAPDISHPHLVSGLSAARVHSGARLLVEDDSEALVRIELGDGVYVADGVELVASANGRILIGTDTSLQTGCLIGGDVWIGAHCLFGRFIVVSSTSHRFRDHPAWLIRDQDREIQRAGASGATPRSRRIVIEDDCWVGQGAVVNPGVAIGRGAIIGANSVVTKDIPPYAVAGGVPAAIIGHRLKFVPPAELNAGNSDHLPYFYRGFCLTRDALATDQSMVTASGSAMLVLAHGTQLRLTGKSKHPQKLQVDIHDTPHTARVDGFFELSFEVPAARRDGMLGGYTVVAIRAEAEWGLKSAEVTA